MAGGGGEYLITELEINQEIKHNYKTNPSNSFICFDKIMVTKEKNSNLESKY